MSLSVAIIVKDEAEHLDACLASLRGLTDEIVVVDTGSTDRTCEIARSFGAGLRLRLGRRLRRRPQRRAGPRHRRLRLLARCR
jgi:glycosyltransferase involved in cell wall biosynthesis